jgi:hypothetical protein
VLAPRDDEHPMVTMTHMSSLQTPMTTTSHEDSSSIEYSYERDAHHGHVDPPIQEVIYDVKTVDPTLCVITRFKLTFKFLPKFL